MLQPVDLPPHRLLEPTHPPLPAGEQCRPLRQERRLCLLPLPLVPRQHLVPDLVPLLHPQLPDALVGRLGLPVPALALALALVLLERLEEPEDRLVLDKHPGLEVGAGAVGRRTAAACWLGRRRRQVAQQGEELGLAHEAGLATEGRGERLPVARPVLEAGGSDQLGDVVPAHASLGIGMALEQVPNGAATLPARADRPLALWGRVSCRQVRREWGGVG